MYSLLNTLSEYTYFCISKNISSYTFFLVFKIFKNLNQQLSNKYFWPAFSVKTELWTNLKIFRAKYLKFPTQPSAMTPKSGHKGKPNQSFSKRLKCLNISQPNDRNSKIQTPKKLLELIHGTCCSVPKRQKRMVAKISLYAKFWSLLLFQKPVCHKNEINLQQLWNNP